MAVSRGPSMGARFVWGDHSLGAAAEAKSGNPYYCRSHLQGFTEGQEITTGAVVKRTSTEVTTNSGSRYMPPPFR
jgi:hypothetical protein